jgi:hypothetical protein
MTPEERQLLSTLADRVRNTPAQQKDPEAEQFLLQLTRERPDAVYILAQTVIMQDFALRNAEGQIAELQRQLKEMQEPAPQSSGSFLGGLFGGGSSRPEPRPAPPSGSVPRVDPWTRPEPGEPPAYSPPPPPQPGYGGYGGGYGPQPATGPVMQPSQTGGFLRNAAATAAGVAGGALLFQGINSLFSGHHSGSLPGWNPSAAAPNESLSETTVVNNYYDQPGDAGAGPQNADYSPDDAGGYQEADYDTGEPDDTDFGGGNDDNWV